MISARLRQAAERATVEGRLALADLFAHEAVLAAEAEHLAAALTSIRPSYRPAAVLALEVAREAFPGLAAEWNAPP